MKFKDPWGSPTGSPKALVSNLNADDPAFDELRADVGKLLDPPAIPAKVRSKRPWRNWLPTHFDQRITRREYWLRVILDKIERLQIAHGRRSVAPLSRLHGPGWVPDNHQNRLRLGSEWFLVADVPDIGGPERKRQMAYWLLDQALRSGEFSQVRRCRKCHKFFISFRRKAQACSQKCNQKFHNEKYQQEGKFMDDYRTRQENKLKLARKYKLQEESAEFIMDKTDLTKLALIRKGIFDKDEI